MFPFDVITLPFAVVLLFIKNNKKAETLNKIILKIHFYMYAVMYIIIYSLVTAILTPFIYLKVLVAKFLQLFVDEIQQYYLAYKIMSFGLYIGFRVILQAQTFIVDLVVFLCCWSGKKCHN